MAGRAAVNAGIAADRPGPKQRRAVAGMVPASRGFPVVVRRPREGGAMGHLPAPVAGMAPVMRDGGPRTIDPSLIRSLSKLLPSARYPAQGPAVSPVEPGRPGWTQAPAVLAATEDVVQRCCVSGGKSAIPAPGQRSSGEAEDKSSVVGGPLCAGPMLAPPAHTSISTDQASLWAEEQWAAAEARIAGRRQCCAAGRGGALEKEEVVLTRKREQDGGRLTGRGQPTRMQHFLAAPVPRPAAAKHAAATGSNVGSVASGTRKVAVARGSAKSKDQDRTGQGAVAHHQIDQRRATGAVWHGPPTAAQAGVNLKAASTASTPGKHAHGECAPASPVSAPGWRMAEADERARLLRAGDPDECSWPEQVPAGDSIGPISQSAGTRPDMDSDGRAVDAAVQQKGPPTERFTEKLAPVSSASISRAAEQEPMESAKSAESDDSEEPEAQESDDDDDGGDDDANDEGSSEGDGDQIIEEVPGHSGWSKVTENGPDGMAVYYWHEQSDTTQWKPPKLSDSRCRDTTLMSLAQASRDKVDVLTLVRFFQHNATLQLPEFEQLLAFEETSSTSSPSVPPGYCSHTTLPLAPGGDRKLTVAAIRIAAAGTHEADAQRLAEQAGWQAGAGGFSGGWRWGLIGRDDGLLTELPSVGPETYSEPQFCDTNSMSMLVGVYIIERIHPVSVDVGD